MTFLHEQWLMELTNVVSGDVVNHLLVVVCNVGNYNVSRYRAPYSADIYIPFDLDFCRLDNQYSSEGSPKASIDVSFYFRVNSSVLPRDHLRLTGLGWKQDTGKLNAFYDVDRSQHGLVNGPSDWCLSKYAVRASVPLQEFSRGESLREPLRSRFRNPEY